MLTITSFSYAEFQESSPVSEVAKMALAVIRAAATLVEGRKKKILFPPPKKNCDSDFLNMPPRELNPLDVTGLSLPRGDAREQWPSCVPNFCLLVL